MAYYPRALHDLRSLLGSRVPRGGCVLDIGSQDIMGSSLDDIRPVMTALHGDRGEQLLEERFAPATTWKISEAFRSSPYGYRSVDLYPGDCIIQADLNTFVVPDEHRGAYDLVANLGSTEHILDQVNVFRCIHDFAKVGALFWHHVPIAGCYNHGLFNYHPLFFVFLARANGYDIESAELLPPRLEYTIPSSQALHGTEAWRGIRQRNGLAVFRIRKTNDRPFQLFTDFDQAVLGRHDHSDAWSEMMKNRYDLRVRDSAGPSPSIENGLLGRLLQICRTEICRVGRPFCLGTRRLLKWTKWSAHEDKDGDYATPRATDRPRTPPPTTAGDRPPARTSNGAAHD